MIYGVLLIECISNTLYIILISIIHNSSILTNIYLKTINNIISFKLILLVSNTYVFDIAYNNT